MSMKFWKSLASTHKWAGGAAVMTVLAGVVCTTSPVAVAQDVAQETMRNATQGVLSRVVDIPSRAVPPTAGSAARFFYGTVGVGEAPVEASSAVYFPAGEAPQGGWPVIAWAHGTVGLNDACAYSTNGPAAIARDWSYIGKWLDQGYAVVAADYAGLGSDGKHPYLNGRVEAHNVVDAVKAAASHYPVLNGNWAVVGQSQGGGAAMATARYADEFGGSSGGLNYRGAVATGVPAYIEEIMPLVMRPWVTSDLPTDFKNPSPNTTAYLLYILSGLRASFPQWDVDSYLTPYGKEWVDFAEGPVCDAMDEPGHVTGAPVTDRIEESNVRVDRLFARPMDEIPGFRDALRDYMGVPETGYNEPVFIGQGGLDTDVFTPGVLALVTKLKANGQPVDFRFYPTQDHSGTVNASFEDSAPFVAELMK